MGRLLERVESHYGRGEYRMATRLAGGMLSGDRYSDSEKAKAGVIGARAALHLSEPHHARELIEKALGFAQSAEDNETEGHSYFVLSAVLICTGDWGTARMVGQTFLSGVEDRWPELEHLTGKVHQNIGQGCRNLRLLPNALQAFTQALARFEKQGDRYWAVSTRHQLAFVLLEMDALDEAEEHLRLALSYGPLSEELSCFQLEHEVALHLKRDEVTLAYEKASELVEPHRPGARPHHKFAGFYALAEVCHRLGRTEEGRKFAYQARDYALLTGIASLLNKVNRLLREFDVAKDGAQ